MVSLMSMGGVSKLPYRIPFNRPFDTGREAEYLQSALDMGAIGGDGAYGRRCEAALSTLLGGPRVLLTTSCTHALEMAALLLRLGAGDEVVMPSYTFVSTGNAFALRGARPVFVDVRPDTLNVDEKLIERALSARTRAIVVVHYAGVACEMDTIMSVADAHDLTVVEDNAHGLGARYKDRPLGSMGTLATQSFHETKNVSCGEGGALVVNDEELLGRAEIIREKGTDRSRFLRGQVDKYTWVDAGSSYVLSDALGAVLCAQLEAFDFIQSRRRAIWERYYAGLSDWAASSGVQLPFVPPECEQAYHMFYLVMPRQTARDALIRRLRDQGILAVFHYVPLHSSPMGASFDAADCPLSESVSARLLRLPFFTGLSEREQDEVIDVVQRFRL